jgi:hypothetical protein
MYTRLQMFINQTLYFRIRVHLFMFGDSGT